MANPIEKRLTEGSARNLKAKFERSLSKVEALADKLPPDPNTSADQQFSDIPPGGRAAQPPIVVEPGDAGASAGEGPSTTGPTAATPAPPPQPPIAPRPDG